MIDKDFDKYFKLFNVLEELGFTAVHFALKDGKWVAVRIGWFKEEVEKEDS